MKIYIKKTETANFELIETPDKELGKGGQARVFNIQTRGYESFCLKKFIREEDARRNYDRIAYMIQNPPKNIMGSSSFRICWPTAFAYDMQKNFIGYIMPLAFSNSRDLKILEVYSAKPISQRYKKYPDWHDKYELDSNVGLKNRMKMLCNWAIAIHSLHETHKYVIVDLKPENVMATSSGKISIVDTDSFQISENGKILFPGAAYTPSYFPPEGKDIQQSKVPFPISCDCFAAAVCFYKILTGVHPFSGTIKLSPYNQLETEEEFISAGLFAYGEKKQYLRFTKDFNLHQNFDNLSPTIQQLFIRAFGKDPSKRPTMEEWGKALHEAAISNTSLIRSIVKPAKTNSLKIQIKEVKFGDEDQNGNYNRAIGSELYTDVEYLKPQITYQVLQTSAPIDIWYKIYSPKGILQEGSNSKPGFTWKGSVSCDTKSTYTTVLGGFGNSNKNCYDEAGTWRIEFYEGDICLYKTTFRIMPKIDLDDTIRKYAASISTSTYQPKNTYKYSRWEKFKDKIKAIGDWFSADDFETTLGAILYVGALIVYIVSIITAWNNDGFWNALLTGILGLFVLGIAYYALVIAAMLIKWILRLIFYNVWTLFTTLIAALLFSIAPFASSWIDNMHGRDFTKNEKIAPIEPVIQTTTYYCTSKSGLKVRNAPSTNSSQLGSLTYGESVEVIEITGEFAKIKYEHANSKQAWVSSKYISTAKPTLTTNTTEKTKSDEIQITSVSFANIDYNQNILADYGSQLYSNVQYLTARIFIKPLSSKKTCKFQVKIYRPDQRLMSGTTSPEDYTFNQEITINTGNSVLYFMGWGNVNGNAYSPGIYKYEIWCDGEKLYTATVNIKSLDEKNKNTSKQTTTNTIKEFPYSIKQDEVYETVEQKPEFPGGNTGLIKFLQANVKYPTEAIEKNIQGRVFVQFIVNKDGSISNPEVIKSANSLLDAEALRVVKSMPNWNPGKQRGEPVRVRFTVPVNFKLN